MTVVPLSTYGGLMTRRLAFALLTATLTATTVRAQTVDLPVQANVLSINPFGFLFEWYSIEYERAFSSTASWSIGVGHIELGDTNEEETSTSADVRLRYYPTAEAPTKFSAGIAFGYSRVTDEDEVDNTVVQDEFDALSIGIDLGYSWLLGRTRQFFIGAGIGAKRLFLLGEDDDDDETFGHPTVRLSIGYAF
jgi:hypothetical protein